MLVSFSGKEILDFSDLRLVPRQARDTAHCSRTPRMGILHIMGPWNASTSICLSAHLCICVHSLSLPLLHPLHPYLFPPCPTFTIIISAGRLLPLDSIFNVSCALISTQTLLQAYEQRWGKKKFDRRWKGRHSKKDKLAKPSGIGINDGKRLLLASHWCLDCGHTQQLTARWSAMPATLR